MIFNYICFEPRCKLKYEEVETIRRNMDIDIKANRYLVSSWSNGYFAGRFWLTVF